MGKSKWQDNTQKSVHFDLKFGPKTMTGLIQSLLNPDKSHQLSLTKRNLDTQRRWILGTFFLQCLKAFFVQSAPTKINYIHGYDEFIKASQQNHKRQSNNKTNSKQVAKGERKKTKIPSKQKHPDYKPTYVPKIEKCTRLTRSQTKKQRKIVSHNEPEDVSIAVLSHQLDCVYSEKNSNKDIAPFEQQDIIISPSTEKAKQGVLVINQQVTDDIAEISDPESSEMHQYETFGLDIIAKLGLPSSSCYENVRSPCCLPAELATPKYVTQYDGFNITDITKDTYDPFFVPIFTSQSN